LILSWTIQLHFVGNSFLELFFEFSRIGKGERHRMSRRTILILGMTVLLLVRPVSIHAWQLHHSTLQRVPLPFVLHLVSENYSADFDDDGLPESLTLTEGRAAILAGDRLRWQSPPAWRVEQALVTDLNRDGIPEVTLLAWRPFKPWPVDSWLPHGGRIESFHDSNGMSCHILLIGWKQGAYRELWAGSAMAGPVKSFNVADLLGNGRQYLVTLEGEYDDPKLAPARRLKVWEWNGFGFTVVQELDDSFTLMDIAIAQTSNGQEVILSP
jgi:hypothetical protein